MAEAVLYGIAEEVLKNVGSTAIREIAAAWGFKARLEKLNNTINTLKDVLLDAEDRQADSRAVRGWLERLTTVVYAADDLFDEFNTVASRKQLMGGNNLAVEVQTFFSSDNQMKFAFHISREIKSIREQLDDIVKDGTQFNFVTRFHEERRVMSMPMRDQTYSFVDAEEVIGRDGDKKIILDMLLASSSTDEEQLSVIPIVGMGGIGKTTLAQLIYNDTKVKDCFEMILWVCVSDVFDIKEITEKILKSATNTETPNLEMEQLQSRLRGEFGGKKYLLILDDVWNENREKWLELKALLKVGRKGSKIMVTTRSLEVAEIMGTCAPHELQGLSEEKSWELFTKMAFNKEAQKNLQIVKVGKEILNKCGNLPLAIRTVGSLLYGKEERKWLSFKDTSLVKLPDNQSDIMSILRLSYDNLWSPLKNCFAYCSLFPKDTRLEKEMLIDLWMAEGFIIPQVNENQSLDEAAEGYFETLLQRCFFQDIERDDLGAITFCKMHDLMHDLAQQVAGVKCKLAKSEETGFNKNIVYLSFAYKLTSLQKILNDMLDLKMLRTLILPEHDEYDASVFRKSICQTITKKFSFLRVLDLHCLNLKSLPNSIGKLIHLRYLNLSDTDIEELPDSITDLHNLQTLNLLFCWHLRALPENIRKLANLRSLNFNLCLKLSHMPSGLARLTNLNRLPRFIVSYDPELRYKPKSSAKLSDLKELNSLRGDLQIYINRDFEKNMLEEATEANLIKKQGLTVLYIVFSSWVVISDNNCKHDEAVFEGLKPHSNLRVLDISGYKGQKLPSWARRGELCSTLPNLINIRLNKFSCEQVPVFSQLHSLKRLTIECMDRVEYMEDGVGDSCSSSSSKSQGMQTLLFFPSLEELELHSMYSLKGWWKGVEAIESSNTSSSSLVGVGQQYDDHPLLLQFCKLSKLKIINCPGLKYLPYCPKVEVLELKDNNERLSVLKMPTISASSSGLEMVDMMKLKELGTNNVEHQLESVPKQFWHQLSSLTIHFDDKIVNTNSLGEVFATVSNSLRSLKFHECDNLRSISQGLEHLTALEKLTFWGCKELDISGNEEETTSSGDGRNGKMMPWLAFKTNLWSLELQVLPKMRDLPSGLQHLTNLRFLKLTDNEELREIPEWISCLSSLEHLKLDNCPKLRYLPEALRKLTALNQLTISGCPGLTERCQRPNGEDCPKFQHVSFVYVKDSWRFF